MNAFVEKMISIEEDELGDDNGSYHDGSDQVIDDEECGIKIVDNLKVDESDDSSSDRILPTQISAGPHFSKIC